MAGRIPQAFIQELIGRADIVEIVGSRVSLKKAGSNYKGLCPFHGEKTPSFTVSPTKGFYHCFGCSAHGTAIDFLMNHDNLSFPEAVEALAEMLGLEVPRTDGHDERPREGDELLAVMREADQIYRHALRESQSAIQYLKQRGIDGATAGRFGMGYAPAAWDTEISRNPFSSITGTTLHQCVRNEPNWLPILITFTKCFREALLAPATLHEKCSTGLSVRAD